MLNRGLSTIHNSPISDAGIHKRVAPAGTAAAFINFHHSGDLDYIREQLHRKFEVKLPCSYICISTAAKLGAHMNIYSF